MNYQQFLESIGATLTIAPDTGWKHTCTLTRDGRSFSFPFFGFNVDVEIVCECTADLANLADGMSFDYWQEEFASQGAYLEAQEQVAHLKHVLGDAYKAFLALDPGGAS